MVDTSPMRPILFTITTRQGDIVTIRDAVEWYKKVYIETSPLGDLTGKELEYVNGEFAQVMIELAKLQGVPAGHLSYMVNQIATDEINLAKAAFDEGESAMMEGQNDEG